LEVRVSRVPVGAIETAQVLVAEGERARGSDGPAII
jgi:hypothetical protein